MASYLLFTILFEMLVYCLRPVSYVREKIRINKRGTEIFKQSCFVLSVSIHLKKSFVYLHAEDLKDRWRFSQKFAWVLKPSFSLAVLSLRSNLVFQPISVFFKEKDRDHNMFKDFNWGFNNWSNWVGYGYGSTLSTKQCWCEKKSGKQWNLKTKQNRLTYSSYI